MRLPAHRDDWVWVLALALPLLARLHGEDAAAAMQRLQVLALALAVTGAWALLFAHLARRSVGTGLPAFALIFVIMLPGPVGFGVAAVALSFGAVFGREVFGGQPILAPAMIGLAFAIYSFPGAGFEALGVLEAAPDPVFALSCVAAAAIVMALRCALPWQVAAGAVLGAVLTGALMDGPSGWEFLARGGFAAGVLLLAASPVSAVERPAARVLHGVLVGALVVVFRLAHPEHAGGVVFAALLGTLFAPLFDRALGWRRRHD